LTQHYHHPTQADFDRMGHWIVVFSDTLPGGDWPDLPYRDVLQQRYKRRFGGEAGDQPLLAELPNRIGSRVALSLMPSQTGAFQARAWGRKLYAALKDTGPAELGIYLAGFEQPHQVWLAGHLLASVLAANADLPDYRTRRPEPHRLAHTEFFGMAAQADFTAVRAADEGNRLARELSMLPPNVLSPGAYRQRLEALSLEQGWTMRFYGAGALAGLGAGAFLAVARGRPEAGIAHLRYRPPRRNGKRLALAGKGICFDTGGHQLKSAKGM
jgi:leucyl aminopeptidase